MIKFFQYSKRIKMYTKIRLILEILIVFVGLTYLMARFSLSRLLDVGIGGIIIVLLILSDLKTWQKLKEMKDEEIEQTYPKRDILYQIKKMKLDWKEFKKNRISRKDNNT